MAIFIFVVAIVLILGGLIFLTLSVRSHIVTIPPILPQEGVAVPLINAFIGTWLFNVHNSAWPLFRLFEDHFEYRVLFRKSIDYSQVNSIDCLGGFRGFGTMLIISFTNSRWNLHLSMNENNLKEVLRYLKSKGCKLTGYALNFISNN
jgi:hypothetical protein